MEHTLKFERSKVLDNVAIMSPDAIPYGFCEQHFGPTHHLEERCYAIYLDAGKKVITDQLISIGGLTAAIVCIPKIMRTAILSAADGIIVIHNHPSGNQKASRADIELAKKLSSAGKTMDIKLLDFMIWTGEDIVSFVQEKLI